MHLLLIEDDVDLGASLTHSLRRCGFTVEWLRTAADAQRFAATGEHDCVLLDLSLPDGNGLELLRAWRAAGQRVPLIVVTASDGLGDRLAGLDEGADDFLVKPFAVEELVSRIHAVLRRAAHQVAPVWRFGDLSIDTHRRQCHLGGEPALLTQREFDILLLLARAGGSVVPKHRLAQALAPLGDPVDFSAIDVHIHNLRRKVGAAYVKTVRGVGYSMRPQEPV